MRRSDLLAGHIARATPERRWSKRCAYVAQLAASALGWIVILAIGLIVYGME